MFDQTYGANPYGMQGGYQFNGMQNGQMPKIPNVLNAEEIKELQQQRSQFSLGLTKKESLQAACNHRTADGMQDTLVYDNVTGIATCTICGYQFRPVEAEATYETIKEASDRLVDILQTIKIMYTDLPAEAAKEYTVKFDTAMDDDMNTADAISAVFELVKFMNTNTNENSSAAFVQVLKAQLEELTDILGLIIDKAPEMLDEEIENMIAERQAARKARNFARADEIRNELLDKGIILEDTREGVKWKR